MNTVDAPQGWEHLSGEVTEGEVKRLDSQSHP